MKNLVKVFKALGDQNRVRILKMLEDREMTGGELREVLKISQPCVSRHLKQLQEAGLVEGRREKLWIVYRLNRPPGPGYVTVLLKNLSEWANRDSITRQDHRLVRQKGRTEAKGTSKR
jgi:ArsR family transcriptional regulator